MVIDLCQIPEHKRPPIIGLFEAARDGARLAGNKELEEKADSYLRKLKPQSLDWMADIFAGQMFGGKE